MQIVTRYCSPLNLYEITVEHDPKIGLVGTLFLRSTPATVVHGSLEIRGVPKDLRHINSTETYKRYFSKTHLLPIRVNHGQYIAVEVHLSVLGGGSEMPPSYVAAVQKLQEAVYNIKNPFVRRDVVERLHVTGNQVIDLYADPDPITPWFGAIASESLTSVRMPTSVKMALLDFGKVCREELPIDNLSFLSDRILHLKKSLKNIVFEVPVKKIAKDNLPQSAQEAAYMEIKNNFEVLTIERQIEVPIAADQPARNGSTAEDQVVLSKRDIVRNRYEKLAEFQTVKITPSIRALLSLGPIKEFDDDTFTIMMSCIYMKDQAGLSKFFNNITVLNSTQKQEIDILMSNTRFGTFETLIARICDQTIDKKRSDFELPKKPNEMESRTIALKERLTGALVAYENQGSLQSLLDCVFDNRRYYGRIIYDAGSLKQVAYAVENELKELKNGISFDELLIECVHEANYQRTINRPNRQSVRETLALLFQATKCVELSAHHNLAIVIGPPGAGKSTTIYSLLGAKVEVGYNEIGETIVKQITGSAPGGRLPVPDYTNSLPRRMIGAYPHPSEGVVFLDYAGYMAREAEIFDAISRIALTASIKRSKELSSIVMTVSPDVFLDPLDDDILAIVQNIRKSFPFAFREGHADNERIYILITKIFLYPPEETLTLRSGRLFGDKIYDIKSKLASLKGNAATQPWSIFELHDKLEIWTVLKDLFDKHRINFMDFADQDQRRQLINNYRSSRSLSYRHDAIHPNHCYKEGMFDSAYPKILLDPLMIYAVTWQEDLLNRFLYDIPTKLKACHDLMNALGKILEFKPNALKQVEKLIEENKLKGTEVKRFKEKKKLDKEFPKKLEQEKVALESAIANDFGSLDRVFTNIATMALEWNKRYDFDRLIYHAQSAKSKAEKNSDLIIWDVDFQNVKTVRIIEYPPLVQEGAPLVYLAEYLDDLENDLTTKVKNLELSNFRGTIYTFVPVGTHKFDHMLHQEAKSLLKIEPASRKIKVSTVLEQHHGKSGFRVEISCDGDMSAPPKAKISLKESGLEANRNEIDLLLSSLERLDERKRASSRFHTMFTEFGGNSKAENLLDKIFKKALEHRSNQLELAHSNDKIQEIEVSLSEELSTLERGKDEFVDWFNTLKSVEIRLQAIIDSIKLDQKNLAVLINREMSNAEMLYNVCKQMMPKSMQSDDTAEISRGVHELRKFMKAYEQKKDMLVVQVNSICGNAKDRNQHDDD